MSHDWRPTASLTVLRARAALLEAVRRFFVGRGYWEVETPLLSRDTCVDTWIDPVAVPHPTRPGQSLYLQTSPEFCMKRLLAAGADAIFEITRSFRRGESGSRHNLEFTILEWYRVGDNHHDQMAVVEALIRVLASTAIPGFAPISLARECNSPPIPADPLRDANQIESGNEVAAKQIPPATAAPATTDPSPSEFPRFTYDSAARAALGTTLLDQPTEHLREIAHAARIAVPRSLPGDDRDGWLNLLLAERIEPWLARFPACFLYDYPASQAALAQVRPGCPEVAERFELYLGGVELCNGYHELTDADELARRMEHHNAARIANGAAPLPTDSRLNAAMRQGLPACSGVALGFDRLAMWRLGQSELRQVLAFPFDRA